MMLHHVLLPLPFLALFACATTESRRVPVEQVRTASTPYNGPRTSIIVGGFTNRTPYLTGVFAEGGDRLGNQSRSILKTHLDQSQRFDLMERSLSAETAQEAQLAGQVQHKIGARLVIAGEISELGQRDSSSQAFFGILGRSREMLAYAKVSLQVVEVATERVLFSVQGSGEVALDTAHFLGFGSSAAYDTTLTDKVLNLAITDAVEKLVAAYDLNHLGGPVADAR